MVAGYSGTDGFSYSVIDGRSLSSGVAQVSIGVGSSNTTGSSKSLQFSAGGTDYLSATPSVEATNPPPT